MLRRGVRGHRVVVDQPTDDGGEDTAPTPTELFVAGLASCVAFYAHDYLDQHRIDPAGKQVAGRFHIGTGRPGSPTSTYTSPHRPPCRPNTSKLSLLSLPAAPCTTAHGTKLVGAHLPEADCRTHMRARATPSVAGPARRR